MTDNSLNATSLSHPGAAHPITEAEASGVQDAIDRALRAQQTSGKSGIAATLLRNGQVIATGENEVHLQNDPTRHAEMVVIGRGAETLGHSDLAGCVLISTLQPCEMCLAAMRFAGIDRVIFAARQENVADKYFAFPQLRLLELISINDMTAIGGVGEDRVLPLYVSAAA